MVATLSTVSLLAGLWWVSSWAPDRFSFVAGLVVGGVMMGAVVFAVMMSQMRMWGR